MPTQRGKIHDLQIWTLEDVLQAFLLKQQVWTNDIVKHCHKPNPYFDGWNPSHKNDDDLEMVDHYCTHMSMTFDSRLSSVSLSPSGPIRSLQRHGMVQALWYSADKAQMVGQLV